MADSNAKRYGIFSYDFATAGRGPARWGLFVLVPFLLLLGGWASFAPINAAAIASGEVILNQDRKTIQHFEGGMVENILVAEGDRVKKGEPILVIRDIAQRTRMNMLTDQLANGRALASRLIAERDGLEAPDFSKIGEGLDLSADELDEFIRTQTNLFNSRRNSVNTKIDLIKARKISAQREIEGIEHQIKSMKTQLTLNADEHKVVADLLDKKLTTGARKMELVRSRAEMEGELGSLQASKARLEQTILSTDIEIIDLKTDSQNTVLAELQTVQLAGQELAHQLNETSDQLARTTINAPVQGKVIDLQVHTRGAVLQPGQRILDIVPDDDRLIIEARLLPTDIDLVKEGLETKIQLSAFKAKKVPKLNGTVLNVSADILADQTTGDRYFLTRVLVDEEELAKLKADVSLYPGMPVDVFFLAGERTVANYLMAPVIDAAYRAFRED